MNVPTAEYKGAKYTYQPGLRVIVIDPLQDEQVRIPLPPVWIVEMLWDRIVAPLQVFYREVYRMAHNVVIRGEKR